jgi:hypothetical protein
MTTKHEPVRSKKNTGYLEINARKKIIKNGHFNVSICVGRRSILIVFGKCNNYNGI